MYLTTVLSQSDAHLYPTLRLVQMKLELLGLGNNIPWRHKRGLSSNFEGLGLTTRGLVTHKWRDLMPLKKNRWSLSSESQTNLNTNIPRISIFSPRDQSCSRNVMHPHSRLMTMYGWLRGLINRWYDNRVFFPLTFRIQKVHIDLFSLLTSRFLILSPCTNICQLTTLVQDCMNMVWERSRTTISQCWY